MHRDALPVAPAVRVRDLRYSAGDSRRGQLEILSGIDLDLADREFVSIVGPSGCGKSTLLNFIAGLLPLQHGHIEQAGPLPDGSHRVGVVFQQHALMPWRTVQHNVELGLELGGVPPAERAEKARASLAEMGLRGFENHYPGELSGGMRQRASLARTLVGDPTLVLMDEPFGALDAQTKTFVHEIFARHWEAHRRTVLFVTHDLSEAVALSDRVLVMGARPGRFTAEHHVDLPRPRDPVAVRRDPRFIELTEAIWADLKDEAARAMQGLS